MFKKFTEWIHAKINIDEKERKSQIKVMEVYWCALGENIGDEENGKGDDFCRPVLVFKKFNNNIFWGIPMSTKEKESIYYIKVRLLDSVRSVMISQVRTLDTKRLLKKIGYISRADFTIVQDAVIGIIKN
ncbi:MAG: type II toxin-antitoxin system PemK/MazF family toxin [bacterium]